MIENMYYLLFPIKENKHKFVVKKFEIISRSFVDFEDDRLYYMALREGQTFPRVLLAE